MSQPAQSPQPAAVRPAAGPAAGPTADEKPLLPAKSRDETDVGWGDPPEPDQSDDEERLRRERPPHWDLAGSMLGRIHARSDPC